MSEVGHDREPETGAWLAFVEPLPALHALSQLDLAQTRPVVINDDGEAGGAVSLLGICPHSRLRPFAGIVEQVPDHLLESSLSPWNLRPVLASTMRSRPRSP